VGSSAGTAVVLELETPHGLARAHVQLARSPAAALVLGHGAGGGVASPDLRTATQAAIDEGLSVALVEQPYVVAGRRSSPPAAQLDEAWSSVLAQLQREQLAGSRLVVGGRSAGARVACRTAEAAGATAVLCLAFPLVSPRGSTAGPAPSRLPELDGVKVPTLVIQGTSDPFGMPPPSAQRKVVKVPGTHSLRGDLEAVRTAVSAWLVELLA
jgi:uncharacterized protein